MIGDVSAAEAREGLRQIPLAGTYTTGDDGLRRFYQPPLAAASS